MLNKTNLVLFGGGFVLGLSLGTAVSYLLTRNKIQKKYEALVNKELVEAKQYYARLYKKDEFSDPRNIEVVEKVDETIDERVETISRQTPEERELLEYHRTGMSGYVNEADPEDLEKVKVVVEANGYIFDYEEEKKSRGSKHPYVISWDEFGEEDEFDTDTLTYYEGDDTLVDTKGEVVPDIEKTVGEANLERFGHGNQDKDIVYIRNHVIRLDLEVLRDPGTYAEKVLGITPNDTG